MKTLHKSLASLCLIPVLFASCMKQKESAATTTTSSGSNVQVNAISTAVSQAQEKVQAISELAPGQTGVAAMIFKKNFNFLMSNAYAALPQEFGDDWEINSPFQDPAYCGSDCAAVYPGGGYHDRSIKYWVQAHLDKNFKRGNGSSANVFGRMNDNLKMVCAVGQALDIPGGGYPANGSYSLTFTQAKITAITSQCDMNIDHPEDLLGFQMTVTVADAATSTYYDKKITLALPNNETQILMLRNNSQFINVATSEKGGHGQSRSVVSYDIVNKKLFYEYVSASAGSGDNAMYVYRIYHNEVNDNGYIVTLEGGGNNGYSDTRFTLAGRPNLGGTVAHSMSRTMGNNFSGKKACITLADGSMASDGVLNCTIPGLDIEDANLTSVLSDAISKRNDTDWADLTSETGIGFTDENSMLTVGVTK